MSADLGETPGYTNSWLEVRVLLIDSYREPGCSRVGVRLVALMDWLVVAQRLVRKTELSGKKESLICVSGHATVSVGGLPKQLRYFVPCHACVRGNGRADRLTGIAIVESGEQWAGPMC